MHLELLDAQDGKCVETVSVQICSSTVKTSADESAAS